LATNDGEDVAAGAVAYFKENLASALDSRDGFAGVLSAALYSRPELLSDKLKVELQRVSAERDAISSQREAIEAFRADVDSSFSDLKQVIEDWRAATQREMTELLRNGVAPWAETSS
jgi:chromosome segregation and condensation protein ScpB